MAKSGSFSFKPGSIDKVVADIVSTDAKISKMIETRLKIATRMVYSVARQRRPMISKETMKAQGRSRRVSDPNAKAGVPVATGALQASIQMENHWEGKKKFVGSVFTDMHYAKYIEFGTGRMAARPFMRPALLLTQDAIKRVVEAKEALS